MNPIQVLIVEDVDEMRLLLAEVVKEIPSVVISGTARSVAEARLERERRRPDLVILDEILPGESALDWLKELQGGPEIAVILVSGASGGEKRPLPAGVHCRLAKPSWKTVVRDRERYRVAIETAKFPVKTG